MVEMVVRKVVAEVVVVYNLLASRVTVSVDKTFD
jgi:hypothetical protein